MVSHKWEAAKLSYTVNFYSNNITQVKFQNMLNGFFEFFCDR